ncbi:MAG: hypothetical protein M3Z11_10825 [Candidatus Dormibacteraeota bacterium]|nr:hypothetical protein [Candidatus Dormibacteraeota bacterium]
MKGLTERWGISREGAAVGVAGIIAFLLILILVLVQLLRPIPSVGPTPLQPVSHQLGPTPPDLPWPTTGSAAVAVEGLGMIGAHGPQTPQPLASTVKMMTALVILEDHPLALAQQGPTILIGADDVATYQRERDQGQSVFPVQAAEQLSEYQALQALLIPSGNNVAELLATWDGGSLSAFVGKMNVRAMSAGLSQTKYTDASGFSPDSVGTPADLIKLAQLAMANPVFAEIVKQPEATLPVAGRVFNVDAALGQEGIIGVKTGSSPQAGACFVFAADVSADNQAARVYGVVMGLPTLDEAFTRSTGLVHAVVPGLHNRSIISTLQVIAEYSAPWGDQSTMFVERDVNWVVYDGMAQHETTDLKPLKPPVASGTFVGSVTVQVGDRKTTIPLRTNGGIFEPDIFWRLTRLGSSSLF